ncbi:DUF262 domain-containing protein [Candidatus Accumulibacter phosphatis]|uniref:DUF262 domain-containing protein n=1 Tax=Candidatus Accumulibacter contiguus TaxID=2954381 RepID=A0ABX1TB80_9PROT|nr:DUF262 domain-containing protein [Candidatus Accumulibacter contiguus]NMQ06246.1 DUF262 domain-containing protein [Candidatus Accumulibacter contiguus]
MPLSDEIETRRRAIKTDSYAMSIGEIMNLYSSKELNINPNFQRMFRWKPEQKTRFIESILLGIPIPSIFVSQGADGVWDLIDGLQRLSTVFEFAGMLEGLDKQKVPPSKLTKAKYLPSLENKVWQNLDDEQDPDSLTLRQRIDIKRAKIDINIIMRESDSAAKYDLFERINTGGSRLSEQEVRNCLLIMANVEFFNAFEKFAENPDFEECIAITDRAKEERYDMELVARFITLRTADMQAVRSQMFDVGNFLSESLVEIATSNMDLAQERNVFDRTFKLINAALGANAFRRYDAAKGRFMGMAQVSAFEAIAIGLGHNIDAWNPDDPTQYNEFMLRVESMWEKPEFKNKQGSGVRGTDRILNVIPFARTHFQR